MDVTRGQTYRRIREGKVGNGYAPRLRIFSLRSCILAWQDYEGCVKAAEEAWQVNVDDHDDEDDDDDGDHDDDDDDD